jgi:hypothetical protein
MPESDLELAKKREKIAAEKLQQVVLNSMNDNTVVENIEAGYVQAQLCLAAIRGLTRLLIHKNVLKDSDLAGSMAWAFEERASQIENFGKEIQIATAPIARPQ